MLAGGFLMGESERRTAYGCVCCHAGHGRESGDVVVVRVVVVGNRKEEVDVVRWMGWTSN